MTAAQHDVIIIGAGQAGLAMAALLQSADVGYLVVGEEPRIGDTWRNRYDSLQLFTPRWLNRLPLDSMPVPADPDGYPDKNEIADYLENYACQKSIQVSLSTKVTRLRRDGEQFVLSTSKGELAARAVVIATGPFQYASIPEFAGDLSSRVNQLHTAQYRNARQLQPGRVLVVGAGNSGAQIAVDLAGHHEVHLSVSGRLAFMPQTVLGRSIFWWFNQLGVYRAHLDTPFGRRLSQRPDPIIGHELKRCLRSGKVIRHPRAVSVQDNRVLFSDGSALEVDNVIWATGFGADYGWLHVSEVLDETGKPRHHRGVTDMPGLYFLGLPWQHSRKSALIGGVGDDAEHLLSAIRAHCLRQSGDQVEQMTNALTPEGCQAS